MTSKVRRAIVAGTLAASTLVVGGIGTATAWAQSGTDTPSASQSQVSGSTGSSDSSDSSDSSARSDDCPDDDANASDSSSADSSA